MTFKGQETFTHHSIKETEITHKNNITLNRQSKFTVKRFMMQKSLPTPKQPVNPINQSAIQALTSKVKY